MRGSNPQPWDRVLVRVSRSTDWANRAWLLLLRDYSVLVTMFSNPAITVPSLVSWSQRKIQGRDAILSHLSVKRRGPGDLSPQWHTETYRNRESEMDGWGIFLQSLSYCFDARQERRHFSPRGSFASQFWSQLDKSSMTQPPPTRCLLQFTTKRQIMTYSQRKRPSWSF